MQKNNSNNFIPRFERNFIESPNEFYSIGNGSLGGKASGLAYIKKILNDNFSSAQFPYIELALPKMIVLRTSIFDCFMDRNNLREYALNEESDLRIVNQFLQSDLPVEILGDLRTIVENIHTPLAIRSSSMLEDAKYEPFAGIYATKMIPNNQPSVDTRFQKLIEAIKFVYASTYFKASKDYFKASTHKVEEEKMGVIIQEVVGKNHSNRYYPTFSGVARSFNFYPSGRSKPKDGVVNLALGLGKTIVDGGIVWSYSPVYPKSPAPFGDPQDIINSTQNSFWAVNLNPLINYDPTRETEYLASLSLNDADYDNTLKNIASTFNSASNKITIGTGIDGPRIINFGPLLQMNEFGFNDLINNLLKICEDVFVSPVEIEFAANIQSDSKKMFFGFLQVRPMVVSDEEVELLDSEMTGENVLVASDRVMGNGSLNNIYDIVFVKPDKFDKKDTVQIAKEIDSINKKLIKENAPYILIGFGRWGSSDSWLGIPVEWGQIGGTKVIVESTLFGINVELSQGSHFFHNLTSFNVSYFSINFDGKFRIDWDWLNSQDIGTETEFVKHVKIKKSLIVKVDGRTGRGVIQKC